MSFLELFWFFFLFSTVFLRRWGEYRPKRRLFFLIQILQPYRLPTSCSVVQFPRMQKAPCGRPLLSRSLLHRLNTRSIVFSSVFPESLCCTGALLGFHRFSGSCQLPRRHLRWLKLLPAALRWRVRRTCSHLNTFLLFPINVRRLVFKFLPDPQTRFVTRCSSQQPI